MISTYYEHDIDMISTKTLVRRCVCFLSMKFLNPAWNVSCFGASRVWCLGVWKVDRCRTAQKHLRCHEGRSASRLSRLCRRTTLVCIATFFISNVASFNPTPASGVGKPLTSKMELKFWGLLLSWFNWFHFQLIFVSFFPQFVGSLLQAHGTRQAEVCKLGYTVSIHTTGDLRDISNLKPNGQQKSAEHRKKLDPKLVPERAQHSGGKMWREVNRPYFFFPLPRIAQIWRNSATASISGVTCRHSVIHEELCISLVSMLCYSTIYC